MDDIKRINLVDIDLNSGSIHRSFLAHSIGTADSKADCFGVRVYRNGEAVSLDGGSVQGYFRNSQGQNIAISNNSYRYISGNTAYIILPQACYNYEGPFTLAVKVINSGAGVTGTMRIVDGMVDNTNTGDAVAPTGTVPTYQEVLAVFGEMQQALEDVTEFMDGVVAPLWNGTETYSAGQYVIHGGKLWRSKVDDNTNHEPPANASNTYWTRCTKGVAEQLHLVTGEIAQEYVPGNEYHVGDYVSRDRKFYRRTVENAGAPDASWTESKWQQVILANDIDALDDVMKSALNSERIGFVSGTFSGTRTTRIYHDFPAGDYHVSVDSITSSDTDSTRSAIVFLNGNDTVAGYYFPRGQAAEANITIDAAATNVMLYASTDYAKGAGDTFEFSGLKISQNYPLLDSVTNLKWANTKTIETSFNAGEMAMYECHVKTGGIVKVTFENWTDVNKYMRFAFRCYGHAIDGDSQQSTIVQAGGTYTVVAEHEYNNIVFWTQYRVAGVKIHIAVNDTADALTRIDRMEETISQAVGNVADYAPIDVLAGTYSGIQSIRVNKTFPAGEYRITIAGITSSDTDNNKSLLMFMKGDTEIESSMRLYSRGIAIEDTISLPDGATAMYMYASDNYSHSQNDTFTVSGLKLERTGYPLIDSVKELKNIKNISGRKILSGTYSGTQAMRINVNIPAGDYIVKCSGITTTDTDENRNGVFFGVVNTQVELIYLSREAGEYALHLSDDVTDIVFWASDTYAHGAGDTFEFSEFSIEEAYPLLGKVRNLDVFGEMLNAYVDGYYSGTRNVSIAEDFPAGKYVVQTDAILSSDTDSSLCTLMFTNSNNDAIASIQLERNTPIRQLINIPNAAKKVFLFAGIDYRSSAGDTFEYKKLKIWKVDECLFDEAIQIPKGFSWTDNPIAGYLYRTDDGIKCTYDVGALKPTAGKTYWVSPEGSDSNAGTSASAPLQSIRTALGKSDAVIIRVMDGFYERSIAPQHINGLSHSVAIVADSGAHPVIASSSGTQTFTKTSGRTYVYETAMNSNAVWDIGNAVAYDRVNSVAEADSRAGSYYCDGTTTYVHTKSGSAPTTDIRCCPASDNFRITTSGAVSIYVEGLTICGGDAGAFRVTCDGSARANVYAKECAFVGGDTWGACYLEGCSSVMQKCDAYGSRADGFGIHMNNTTGTIPPLHIEIDCEGHHNGVAGNTTSNGSTAHAKAHVIRVNGKYHDNVGPNVADVHNGTQSWNLGCNAYKSLTASGGQQSDFVISDGTAKMWLETCSGFGSDQSLQINTSAAAYVKNCAFAKIGVSGTGKLEAY